MLGSGTTSAGCPGALGQMRRALDAGGPLTDLWLAWRPLAVVAAVGPAAAGLGHVAQAGAVAAEGGRPLQLVHGDIDGLTQGRIEGKGTARRLQQHLQKETWHQSPCVKLPSGFYCFQVPHDFSCGLNMDTRWTVWTREG